MPTKVDLSIYRGDTYRRPVLITKTGVDFAGSIIRAQVRKSHEDASVAFTLPTTAVDTTVSGRITFEILLTPAQTSILKPGKYVYDIEIQFASGVVDTAFEGFVTVLPDVSRS